MLKINKEIIIFTIIDKCLKIKFIYQVLITFYFFFLYKNVKLLVNKILKFYINC